MPRYPADVARFAEVADRIAAGPVLLPDGDLLSVRRLQTVGQVLGTQAGYEELHWLVEEALDDDARLARSMAFFAGGHDLVVPRRHVTDDDPEALASSATLTPSEHAAYVRFTVASIERLREEPHVEMPNAFVFGLRESHIALTPE